MSKGKLNVYACEKCGKQIVTIDREDGVTPFVIRCMATRGCRGFAESSFYEVDQTLEPTVEWIRPEPSSPEIEGNEEHVARGGLVQRFINPEARPGYLEQNGWTLGAPPAKDGAA